MRAKTLTSSLIFSLVAVVLFAGFVPAFGLTYHDVSTSGALAKFNFNKYDYYVQNAGYIFYVYNATNNALIRTMNLTAPIGAAGKTVTFGCSEQGFCVLAATAVSGTDKVVVFDPITGFIPAQGSWIQSWSSNTAQYVLITKEPAGSIWDRFYVLNRAGGAGNLFVTSYELPIADGSGNGIDNATIVSGVNWDSGLAMSVRYAAVGFDGSQTFIGLSSVGTGTFYLWSISTLTKICSYNPSALGGADTVTFVNETNSYYWLFSQTNAAQAYKIHENTCTTDATIDMITFGLSSYAVRSHDYNVLRHEWYFLVDASGSSAYMLVVNSTGASGTLARTSLLATYPFASAGGPPSKLVIADTPANSVAISNSAGKTRFIYWGGTTGVSQTQIVEGQNSAFSCVTIDTSGGKKTGLLNICDNNGDGYPDSTSTQAIYNTTDPATAVNGVGGVFGLNTTVTGLIASAVVHLIVIVGFAVIFAKVNAQVPLFVYAFLMLIAGGICAAIGFMPLLYFFAELAAVVGGFAFIMSKGMA